MSLHCESLQEISCLASSKARPLTPLSMQKKKTHGLASCADRQAPAVKFAGTNARACLLCTLSKVLSVDRSKACVLARQGKNGNKNDLNSLEGKILAA